MPAIGVVKRKDLIRYFKQLGFEGPFSGTKHQFMVRSDVTVTIPNPHQRDIGMQLLVRILRQAKVSKAEWETL